MADIEAIHVPIIPEIEWGEMLSTANPPTISIYDINDDLPLSIGEAVLQAVREACDAVGVPIDRVVSATFRGHVVDEVVVRITP